MAAHGFPVFPLLKGLGVCSLLGTFTEYMDKVIVLEVKSVGKDGAEMSQVGIKNKK